MFEFDSYIAQMLTFLFPKDCFEVLFVRMDILDSECLHLVISRLLGFGIIIGSVLVKVPQILKVLRAQSGEGISLVSQTLELVMVTSTAAYSVANRFPFSAWGEALFLAIQSLIMCVLILWYGDSPANSFVFGTVYVVCSAVLYLQLLPMSVLSFLQFMVIPFLIVARTTQILTNLRNQSTGQLSAITLLLVFAGSLARIFTSIQETGDRLTIWTYIVAGALNGILVGQLFIYWGKEPIKRKQQ